MTTTTYTYTISLPINTPASIPPTTTAPVVGTFSPTPWVDSSHGVFIRSVNPSDIIAFTTDIPNAATIRLCYATNAYGPTGTALFSTIAGVGGPAGSIQSGNAFTLTQASGFSLQFTAPHGRWRIWASIFDINGNCIGLLQDPEVEVGTGMP